MIQSVYRVLIRNNAQVTPLGFEGIVLQSKTLEFTVLASSAQQALRPLVPHLAAGDQVAVTESDSSAPGQRAAYIAYAPHVYLSGVWNGLNLTVEIREGKPVEDEYALI